MDDRRLAGIISIRDLVTCRASAAPP